MNSKAILKKNSNYHKLDYICFNKIKSIPKNNIISRKILTNLDISNNNNSIEINSKAHQKFRKINRHNQQKPILSERLKRNYSNGNKKGTNYEVLNFAQNSIYKISNTEMNSFNNILGLSSITLSPNANGLNRNRNTNTNIKNIFDKNIIINNNNFDKKIIFLGGENNYNYEDDTNQKIAKSTLEILPYENENERVYENSKTSIDYSNSLNQQFEYTKRKSKNNLSLNLSDTSCNDFNYKSLKNLNKSKNKNSNIIKENENLKAELNKFLKENINLKIKMNTLQKNGQNI